MTNECFCYLLAGTDSTHTHTRTHAYVHILSSLFALATKCSVGAELPCVHLTKGPSRIPKLVSVSLRRGVILYTKHT